MNTAAFESQLRQDGFLDVETRSLKSDVSVPVHTHAFEVRALVLSGELTLGIAGKQQTCRAGDTFTMPAHCEHSELYGPQGVTYLVGRKHPPA